MIEQEDAQKVAKLLKAALARAEEAEKATRGEGRFALNEEGIANELMAAGIFARKAAQKIDEVMA